MTPEQREAAIQSLATAWVHSEWDADTNPDADDLTNAAAALDALLSEFVVLHRDDVTIDRRAAGDLAQTIYVTRWVPITKENTDA